MMADMALNPVNSNISMTFPHKNFVNRATLETKSIVNDGRDFVATSDGSTFLIESRPNFVGRGEDNAGNIPLDVVNVRFQVDALPASGSVKFEPRPAGVSGTFWTLTSFNRGTQSGEAVVIDEIGTYKATFTYNQATSRSTMVLAFIGTSISEDDFISISDFEIQLLSVESETTADLHAKGLGGIWNQWIEPLAVHKDNVTYWGSIDGTGDVLLHYFNHITKEFGRHLVVDRGGGADDHNAPALYINSAGFIEIYYAGHPNDLSRVVSNDLNDLSSWDAPTVVDAAGRTYAQIFGWGDNRVLIGRDGDPLPADWVMSTSSDGGANWTHKSYYDTTGDDYINHKQVGRKLCAGSHQHPLTGGDQGIWYFEIDLDTGDCTIPGGSSAFANVYDDAGTVIDDRADLLEVHTDLSDDVLTRLFSVNDKQVVFAKFVLKAATAPTAITAFSDATGGFTTVTSSGHGLVDGEGVDIVGTTSYNGTEMIVSGVAGDDFNIEITFVADDATGTAQLSPLPVDIADATQPSTYYYSTIASGGAVTEKAVALTGLPLELPNGKNAYFCGATIKSSGVLYITREESSTWFLEQYTLNGSDWVIAEMMRYTDRKVLRPVVPTNANDEMPVCVLTGFPTSPNGGYTLFGGDPAWDTNPVGVMPDGIDLGASAGSGVGISNDMYGSGQNDIFNERNNIFNE